MVENGSLTLVESLVTLYRLKNLKRAGWLRRGIPYHFCESVAGHSYRAAQAGFHYTQDLEMVKMLLFHDLAEAIVGDITPHDGVDPAQKRTLEIEAIGRITAPLPYGTRIMQLWQEFERGETSRSRIARQVDKLDAAVMALVYENRGFNVSEFYAYTRKRLQDPRLVNIFDILLRREHNLPDSHRVYFRLLREARCNEARPASYSHPT